MSVAVELEGVNNVVEHRVEAAGKGGYGGEERVAQPDGENRVFLTQGLAGGNLVVPPGADASANDELKRTSNQRNGAEPELRSPAIG